MNQQNCSICSLLNDYERAFQKSGEGTFLPQAAEKLIVLYDLRPGSVNLGGDPPIIILRSRLLQLRQCPNCETFYLYRTDYEFIYGGSEDEQILERLTNEQAFVCREKLMPTFGTSQTPSQSPDLQKVRHEANVLQALQKNKDQLIKTLQAGLSSRDADDINEVIANLEEGACDYLELIPILKRFAGVEFFYFDDNGAGGYPKPVSDGFSLESTTLSIIKNIEENAQLGSKSITARALKSNDPALIKRTLEGLKTENICDDKSLTPILTKIARKNDYQHVDYSTSTYRISLESLAREVITIIHRNYKRD